MFIEANNRKYFVLGFVDRGRFERNIEAIQKRTAGKYEFILHDGHVCYCQQVQEAEFIDIHAPNLDNNSLPQSTGIDQTLPQSDSGLSTAESIGSDSGDIRP